MSQPKIKQIPLTVDHDQRRNVRTQFGALCYRLQNEKPQFLLITSRGKGRWIVPKGWPVEGMTPAEAAAAEAYEEAGVEGRVGSQCQGLYSYIKEMPGEDNLHCVVAVYPFRVKRMLSSFPEQGERRRKWFGRKKAARLVSEPELRDMILRFAPHPGLRSVK